MNSRAGGPSTPWGGGNGTELEAPYTGEPGRTRVESIHVLLPDGSIRSVAIHRAVNVATDPSLRDASLAGALHRFESGEELAIAYVYHDPNARKFALVLPESLRHEALRERARLLSRIADDPAHSVPAYVRDVRVVVGVSELVSYLRDAVPVSDGAEQARAAEPRRLDDKARAMDAVISQREARLSTLTEMIGTREAELRALVARMERVRSELELTRARVTNPATGPIDTSDLVDDDELSEDISEQVVDREVTRNRVQRPEESDVEDADSEISGVDVSGADVAADDSEELLASEVVAEEEEVDPAVVEADITGVGPPPEPPAGHSARTVATIDATRLDSAKHDPTRGDVTSLDLELPPTDGRSRRSSLPPAGQRDLLSRTLIDNDVQLAARLENDRVLVDVRLDPDRRNAFAGEVDLLTQLVVVAGHPVVVLSLIDGTGDRPYVRRGTLDPRANDRAILERLAKDYVADATLHAAHGETLRTIEVKSKRERNVSHLLARIDALPKPDGAIDIDTAIERALAAPPPIRDSANPFTAKLLDLADEEKPVREALDRVGTWSSDERMDHVLLGLAVSRAQVDDVLASLAQKAVRHGLVPTRALRERMVQAGAASDDLALLSSIGIALEKSTAAAGLSPVQAGARWRALLDAAAESEIVLPDAIRTAAWRAIQTAAGSTKAIAAAEMFGKTETLPSDLDNATLIALLDLPATAKAAALALVGRSDAAAAVEAVRAANRLPSQDVGEVFAALAKHGEAASEALLLGLASRSPSVRLGASLALARTKLRSAIVPLVQALQTESTDVWRDIARAIGDVGSAAERALARAAKDPKSRAERLTLALSHFGAVAGKTSLEGLIGSGSHEELVRDLVARALAGLEEAKATRAAAPTGDAFDPVRRAFASGSEPPEKAAEKSTAGP